MPPQCVRCRTVADTVADLSLLKLRIGTFLGGDCVSRRDEGQLQDLSNHSTVFTHSTSQTMVLSKGFHV